jgi:hypothetical protein
LVKVGLFLALVVSTAAMLSGDDPSAPGTRRLLAKVDEGVSLPAAARQLDGYRGATVTRALEDLHALDLRVPEGSAARIAEAPGVAYAEFVVPVTTADSPSDPLYSQQSAYLAPVGASQAWDIEKGRPGVIVAVVDTGVDVTHPDLAPNIWVNPFDVPNNGTDDDGNGCVDDRNGCAFVSDSSPGCQNVTNGFVRDDIGHGTFVAGVIAAAGNGQGMVGVARGVRVMPVKVLDCYGAGDSVATARGILYAARHGARVINLSLGGLQDAQVVRDAIQQVMFQNGALVVAAAGNSGAPGVAFPARVPEVLAVGATTTGGDRRASFSSYGREVDLVAAGEGIVGTIAANRCSAFLPCINRQPYAKGNGTSFSTPQVSGLAALILSMNPGLSPGQLSDVIKNSATAMPAGDAPGWAGAGRINMPAALRAVRANTPPGEACVVESVIDGESFSCGGRVVRLLQVDAPDLNLCGGQWARDALRNIFLIPGRTVHLRYDVGRVDAQGRTLAAPLYRGTDGHDYNISIVMVYVGLARAAETGQGNGIYRDWAFSAEAWAAAMRWNMWAPGKPFLGGC